MSELHLNFLLEGIALGLLVAIPVGPISILCMHRSIERGFLAGFVSGVGACTGDLVYTLLGLLGLGLDATWLVNHQMWLSLIGGLILCYLGVTTFLQKPSDGPDAIKPAAKALVQRKRLLQDYVTTLLLNQVNPMTIIPFVAVFSRLYATGVYGDTFCKATFGVSVIVVVMLWRAFISQAASWFGAGLNSRQQRWINQGSGILIVAFGCTTIF